MPALETIAGEKLNLLADKHLRRKLYQSERTDNAYIVRDGKKLISFSCNDYLGLSKHPKVVEASINATKRYGVGAGASRLVTGNYPLYDELETLLAAIKGTESACIFGSGYLANIGVIPTLVGKGDYVVADKQSHACIHDGIKLSDASYRRFLHNDMTKLDPLLRNHRGKYNHALVVTETVFSMDGDCAPLKRIKDIAHANDAWLLTDDAHGLGTVPAIAKADIQMGTLSKAVGSYGGYVCASNNVVEHIKTSARSVMFSTALPPGVVAASIAALEIIGQDQELCSLPLKKARLFTDHLGLKEAESSIVPLIMGDAQKALDASSMLEEEGFLAVAIRPPTVPQGTARLRFTFSAQHKDSDIERLAQFIKSKGWV